MGKADTNPPEREPALTPIPESLRASARRRAFTAGQVLYARGEPPEGMLCVLSGEVRLVRHTRAGGEIVVQRSRGGFVAEASMDAPAYHCDVVAAEDGEMLVFPREDFRATLERDPAFNRHWITRLSRELRTQRARNERLGLKTAEERILHFIQSEGENGRVTLSQTRKAWAAELGLSHEALYRALGRLRERGTLTIDGATLGLG